MSMDTQIAGEIEFAQRKAKRNGRDEFNVIDNCYALGRLQLRSRELLLTASPHIE